MNDLVFREWDMDDDGLACAVVEGWEVWFLLQVPPGVTKDKFVEMQEDLRVIARRYGCDCSKV